MNIIELENIHKIFPSGVHANKGISLDIREGEVHGLLGENGAGKSTLMNILYGLLEPTRGKIRVQGKEIQFQSPQDAILRGIGMVHQHFKLIPTLSVTENIILGLEPVYGAPDIPKGIIQRLLHYILPTKTKDAAKKIREIAEANGMKLDPDAKVRDLSVGIQQRVEIIKTLYREADILILDEPTSVLTPQEVDELFVSLEKFKEQGKTIILITHKLREPMMLCDRISVLRDGELVGTVNRDDTSPEELAEMMVGRSVVFEVEKEPATPGDDILKVDNLTVVDHRDLEAVSDVSFTVRSGEIFGIAGVEGNGQTELVEAITGLIETKSGKVMVDTVDITGKSPKFVREAGVSHIPEDRHKRGLILPFSITENVILGSQYKPPFAHQGVLDLEESEEISKELVDSYSIKVKSTDDLASMLSGGNQQKVIVARELSRSPKLVIAAQPTRGLDVGATEYIHNVLIEMRDKGAAILLISAELDEIQSLADRIGVMFDGKIVAIKEPSETSKEELGLLMAGHQSNEEVIA